MSILPSKPKTGASGLRQRHLLWIIPLGIVAVAGATVLALPKLVSSGYHRATIEALASSLTGREVHIRGKLFLTLLPHPQFIAGDITITSPDKETITAPSLTLDIAPIPLLHGQILARSITLQSPHIALPWPLPGGAAAIAPPRWLTALHAVINDGVVSLGGITFDQVYVDIFTGGDGAFSVSGTGNLAGHPLTLSLGCGGVSAVGSAPMTLDIQTNNAANLRAHITGTYDSSSTFFGKVGFGAASLAGLDPALSAPVTASGDITADPEQVALSDVTAQEGSATLSGSATLALHRNLLTILLSGQNLVLPLNANLLAAGPALGAVHTHLALDAGNARLAKNGRLFAVPQLHGIIDFSPAGASFMSVNASLPGSTNLWLRGALDSAGNLLAKAVFSSARLGDFIAAYGPAPVLPSAWQTANLAGSLHGTAEAMIFDGLAGNIGPSRFTGSLVLDQQRTLNGALHFGQLDLTPALTMRNPQDEFGGDHALDLDLEISADHASIHEIPLGRLLIDASLGNRLVVRRLTSSLWGGITAASFTLAPSAPSGATPDDLKIGVIGSARAIIALPSAQPLASLLPAGLQPPPSISKAPLALSFLAAGSPNALATSASLTLGEISITASPSIDLLDETATGAFTFRHPNAIAAFKAFGTNAGLAWPGAGSISLRANMLLSPSQIGLSDFVLSMGNLTANGALIYGTDHRLNGEIDADTLALPPIPANFTLPWADLAALQGNIAISANRVLWEGNQFLGPAAASLGIAPNRLDLTIARANLANGVLNGEFSATGNSALPGANAVLPAIGAKFSVTGADASLLNLPLSFPITLPTGNLDAAADLTASGYAPEAWLDTLSGNASLTAKSGTLSGFDLPNIANILTTRERRQRLGRSRSNLLRNACLGGTTPFSALRIAGNFSSGIYTLAGAAFQSPSGAATATGSIDLPDTGVALKATLFPNLPAPPALPLTIAGTWTNPRKVAQLKQALAWQSTSKAK